MNLAEMTSAVTSADVTLSIIIPVYNEQAMLDILQTELDKVISGLTKEKVEIVYINDGSSDDSWSLLCQLRSPFADIRCLDLSRNFCKETAVSAGLDHARGQAVILIDADLQDPPSYIPAMIEAHRQGFDVVNMQRTKRFGEGRFKRCCAFLYYRLLNALSDIPLQADVGDFRLLSRRVVEQIKQLPERNRYMKGIMSWPGFKQTTLTFERPERVAGDTKWSFLQLLRLGVAGITALQIEQIENAIDEMEGLTHTLLLLARQSDGDKEKVVVDQTLLNDWRQEFVPLISANQVDLSVFALNRVTLSCHPVLFKALVVNLLKNAINCSINGKVELQLSEQSLVIVDDGVGLKQKARGYEGFGIGLNIVHDICHKVGWRFTLCDNDTNGCTARVNFATSD